MNLLWIMPLMQDRWCVTYVVVVVVVVIDVVVIIVAIMSCTEILKHTVKIDGMDITTHFSNPKNTAITRVYCCIIVIVPHLASTKALVLKAAWTRVAIFPIESWTTFWCLKDSIIYSTLLSTVLFYTVFIYSHQYLKVQNISIVVNSSSYNTLEIRL